MQRALTGQNENTFFMQDFVVVVVVCLQHEVRQCFVYQKRSAAREKLKNDSAIKRFRARALPVRARSQQLERYKHGAAAPPPHTHNPPPPHITPPTCQSPPVTTHRLREANRSKLAPTARAFLTPHPSHLWRARSRVLYLHAREKVKRRVSR